MDADYRKLYVSVCSAKCVNDIKKRYTPDKNCKHRSLREDVKILGKGGQGTVYLYDDSECGISALKISKNIVESHNELFFLEHTKKLVDDKVCPNFVYNYCGFTHEKEVYILNEYADGTLENWLTSRHDEQEWFSMLFQIICSLYVFQRKIFAVHNDLKPKNILFRRITQGELKYIIHGNTYCVPTYGNLFMMADYGKSVSSLQKNSHEEEISSMIKMNADYEYINTLPKRILVSAIQKKYMTLENLFKKLNIHRDDRFTTYMEHERDKIDRDLAKYPQNIKDRMLMRSVVYYMIERKLIKKSNIEDNFFYEKYPPDIVDEILNYSTSIEELLDILGKKISSSGSTKNLLDTFTID